MGKASFPVANQIGYFTKGQQGGRLNYDQVAEMKLPIGSGAIESLIRQVVNLRLKGNGKFWLLENASRYYMLDVNGLLVLGQLFATLF